MKIAKCEVFINSPGRNYVTVRLTTDDGITGLGDGTLNGRELAVRSYLADHLFPCLEGRDPFDTEDIWQYFYKGAYWRRGPVGMTALGAIDVALGDIKAKALGVPLFQLLGGRSRQRVWVYTHVSGSSLDHVLRDFTARREEGYTALRVQCAVPGLKKIYGITPEGEAYEPAIRAGQPFEEQWDTRKYLNYVPRVFARVREEFGPDPALLHDAHHRLTPTEAARLGRALEPYDLFWLEDAVPAENPRAFQQIRAATTTPLAVGEIFNTLWDMREIIENRWVDYVRMTVSHGGGLTPMLKIAHLAEVHALKMACHGPSDISPIALAACLHFDMAIHNFGIQEYMGYPPETTEVFPVSYQFREGSLWLDDNVPGLGVEYRQELADQHPYQRAYLPVNRLTDGTMHDW